MGVSVCVGGLDPSLPTGVLARRAQIRGNLFHNIAGLGRRRRRRFLGGGQAPPPSPFFFQSGSSSSAPHAPSSTPRRSPLALWPIPPPDGTNAAARENKLISFG